MICKKKKKKSIRIPIVNRGETWGIKSYVYLSADEESQYYWQRWRNERFKIDLGVQGVQADYGEKVNGKLY